jgi:hypothetical protein
MSEILSSGMNDIKISCITTDKKHGTWWAFATKKEWIEIRTTRTGRIKVFNIQKKKHPIFQKSL